MKVGTSFPRLLAAMLIAAGLFALEGQRANADDLATIRQRGTLVVGVKADYRPFDSARRPARSSGSNPRWPPTSRRAWA